MARIRVLQIVTRLAVRGVPRHVLELAARLDPERYAVELLAGRSEPGEGDLWEEARARGVTSAPVETLRRPVAPLADLRAFATIYCRLRKARYDVVHTHISKAGVLGRLAARLAGVPVVLHTYHGRLEELHNPLLLSCERLAARAADALVAVSQDTAAYLRELGIGDPGRYEVIPNGVDLERFGALVPPVRVSGRPLVGTVASLTREKGVDVLLQAVAGLAGHFPELRLVVVGDGPLRPELEAQARDLGVRERVEFVGVVEDVRPWLAGFEVFVLPSRSEGMSLVLLEAMAMGRPVVASRAGGVPEMLREGQEGCLVPPGDVAALRAAVEELLRDGPRRQTLGQAARARAVQEFGLERMVRRVEQLYERLLASRGRR